MTKARDIANLLSTANGKIAGSNLDVSFENISDTGTEGTKVDTILILVFLREEIQMEHFHL
jgi:hypothetical protein